MSKEICILGGKNDIWSGHLVRKVKQQAGTCVVLPKKESSIAAQVVVPENNKYNILLFVKSNIKTEIIIDICYMDKIQSFVIEAPYSKAFVCQNVEFELPAEHDGHIRVVARKAKHDQCEISIAKILIKCSDNQDICDGTESTRCVKNTIDFKKWIGRNISNTTISGDPCIVLNKKESCAQCLCDVLSNKTYEVSIIAKRIGGRGECLFNFFSNKHVGGKSISVSILSESFKTYSFVVNTPSFIKGLPMYARLWKNNLDSGQIYIKSIYITEPATKPQIIKSARPVSSPVTVPKYNNNIEFDNIKAIPTNFPLVSIILSSTDCACNIETINKILKNTAYQNIEIIVPCTLDTKIFKNNFNKIIQSPAHKAHSLEEIKNNLADRANGQFLLFMDNDVYPAPYWIYHMLSLLLANDSVALVAPKILNNSSHVISCGMIGAKNGWYNVGVEMTGLPDKFDSYTREFNAVNKKCFLIRKEDFSYFSTTSPNSELLLFDTIQKMNKKIVCCSNSMVYCSSVNNIYTANNTSDLGDYFKCPLDRTILPSISFVTNICNHEHYINGCLNSIMKNCMRGVYCEFVPVRGQNINNSKALNVGISVAQSSCIVVCNDTISFDDEWAARTLGKISAINDDWGVTGITNIRTSANISTQTCKENCFIINKQCKVSFDENNKSDACHGIDVCLQSLSKGHENYLIYNPITDSRLNRAKLRRNMILNYKFITDKWSKTFNKIRIGSLLFHGNDPIIL